MTAQAHDELYYNGQQYSIVGINGSKLFNPNDHNINPVMISTACWRGYVCTYEVVEKTFYLKQLNIGLGEQDQKIAERGEGPKLFGKIPQQYYLQFENSKTRIPYGYIYEDLEEHIFFSGGLLLGRDFIQEMYVHMGFHPAYKYRQVWELTFVDGKLEEETDCSSKMGEFREMIANRPLEPINTDKKSDIESWIQQCFSLDYKL